MSAAPHDAVAASADAETGSIGPVIDLRDGPTTRVRVQRDDNPFTSLAPPERMRLIIRVLCELVAYDEIDAAEERRRTVRAAMEASERPVGRATPRPEPAPDAGAPTSITG
jgi:hypothetical protein